MSDDETFLARWSRRKREAVTNEREPVSTEQVRAETDAPPAPAPEQGSVQEAGPGAKLELPPVETIDATTDIRVFLQKGVPQDLTRAALRRAWSSDPAIRDFIGLSENSWDFNDPNGVPGFAPSVPDAARELIARMFGGNASPPSTAPVATPAPERVASPGPGHEKLNVPESSSSELLPGALHPERESKVDVPQDGSQRSTQPESRPGAPEKPRAEE